MAGLEAEADIWLADAEQFRISADLVVEATRGMLKMSLQAAAPYLKRQRENIDAMIRQAYIEGFYHGGESRKAYDAEQGAKD